MSDPDRRSDPSPSSHRTLVSARDVGGRIRARLEQLGIKRSEAAHRMGMRRPGIFYDWVDGKQLPSLDYLPDLVRVLGMTAEMALAAIRTAAPSG